ncbi:MAG: nucleotide exchange factor GrpE [Oligosphaeraceae bacterium]|nr:nucleotide exchange factor GrpE [Oligosphaeraceae bacterium]
MSDKNKKEGKDHPVSPESLPDAEAETELAISNQNQDDADGKAAAAQPEPLPDPSPEELLALANDRYLRARADFENYRKRMAREFTDVRENARQQTLAEFLGIYDFILLAIEHAETAIDMDAIRQGLRMIFAEFERTFDNLGVKRIETADQDFDPNLHEAISQEASADIPEGKIIRQWKPGFTLGNRLLRPASVVVSSGQPEAPQAAEETGAESTSNQPEK